LAFSACQILVRGIGEIVQTLTEVVAPEDISKIGTIEV
jgi:hypothetical protein